MKTGNYLKTEEKYMDIIDFLKRYGNNDPTIIVKNNKHCGVYIASVGRGGGMVISLRDRCGFCDEFVVCERCPLLKKSVCCQAGYSHALTTMNARLDGELCSIEAGGDVLAAVGIAEDMLSIIRTFAREHYCGSGI